MSIYTDINQYTPTAQVLLTNIESIYQSLNNILTTKPGERVFNPEFGGELDDLLFTERKNANNTARMFLRFWSFASFSG